MAKKVRDTSLDSKAARERLAPRGKPYWRLIDAGLHLGYRKLKNGKPGTWTVRHYVGNQQYEVESLGSADDIGDANNADVLSFSQAQERARERKALRVDATTGLSKLTVHEAVADYILMRDMRDSKWLGREVNSDASQRLRKYVIGAEARGVAAAPLARVPLKDLDDDDLKAWVRGLPDTLKGTTVRRLVNDLRAALMAAYSNNRKRLPATLPSTIKFGLKLEPSDDDDDDDVRENQILPDRDITRLLAATREIDKEYGWDGDLLRMITVLATTGARLSQVARMRVRDVQLSEGRLLIPTSRKGKGEKARRTTVPVFKDVLDALRPVVNGRKAGAFLLERWLHKQEKGGEWSRVRRVSWLDSGDYSRAWNDIRNRAKLPHAIPYCLRHSSIVRGLRAGLPTRLVAALHDTSVVMIERHYSRWITDGLEDLAARATVPLMPPDADDVVVRLRK